MTQQMTSPILVLADQAGDRLTPLARQAVTLAASLTSGDVVALSVAAAPDTRSLSELGATRVLHACMGDAARSSVVASDAIIAALETDSFGLVLLGSDYRSPARRPSPSTAGSCRSARPPWGVPGRCASSSTG